MEWSLGFIKFMYLSLFMHLFKQKRFFNFVLTAWKEETTPMQIHEHLQLRTQMHSCIDNSAVAKFGLTQPQEEKNRKIMNIHIFLTLRGSVLAGPSEAFTTQHFVKVKVPKSAIFCMCRHISNVAKILKFTVSVRQI